MKQQDKIGRLDNRVRKLEKKLKTFMERWGPDVQKKRDERDAKWDEMVKVLQIQERNRR
tara:strand:+ start:968 stop:1144 length:177 start_codon:yes stop_codon:yes gene_type:complete